MNFTTCCPTVLTINLRCARRVLVLLTLSCVSPAFAQRDLRDIPDPDPELERKSFIVAEGFEVNLFAADPLIAKPIQMNFDSEGRLWIASSEVYPHIKPGQKADDKILVLQDTNDDGRADETTVFARGLLIPTGVVPGDGGAYVANSTELIHLSDADGDGQADRRRIVLSGFGTEDTHHLLHTLRWGPDGMLYMNQSIYIHSHVETPYGVRHLNAGGIWQFRPETMRLEVFCRGFVNPWGHHFDRWGQSFATDGAYGEGTNYVFPGAVFVTAYNAKRRLKGLNPGSPKHCGLEILSGRHLPPAWRGNMITNDFRAHRVCRFVVSEDGAGYASRQETELIKTKHVAFRPIDVKMGPDGAVYIADWYNPIIQHGEVDFRDPRRDHVHGRIWRVTAKGRPTLKPPNLVQTPTDKLLDHLKDPEQWVRLQAKLVLKSRGANEVLPRLAKWVENLDERDDGYEHHRLEALWLGQCLSVLDNSLLRQLLASGDHRVRAAAVRVLSQMKDSVDEPVKLLAVAVDDEHPRVRLEAVRALAGMKSSHAAALALRVLDRPMDRFLDFAVWQAMRDLAPFWLADLQRGNFDAGGNVNHLAFALRSVDSGEVVGPLLSLLEAGAVEGSHALSVVSIIAEQGDAKSLGKALQFVLAEKSKLAEHQKADALDLLVQFSRQRKLRPAGNLEIVADVFAGEPDKRLFAAATRAAGLWKIESLRQRIQRLASSANLRRAAADHLAVFQALASYGDAESKQKLIDVAAGDFPFEVRAGAIIALLSIDVRAAANYAAQALLQSNPSDETADPRTLVSEFASRPYAAKVLTQTLNRDDAKLNPELAKLAIRGAQAVPKPPEPLIATFRKIGHLADTRWKLTPELLRELVAEVQQSGNAHRGESVYRRKSLQCMNCHAIGGAGGRVGPDLVSIGASAQVDYLLQSLIEPNAKVKENFHTKMFLLLSGKLVGGIPVQENGDTVVIRDAQDREVRIAKDDIDQMQDGRSLMPDGLVDQLTRAELVDLTRFLSELGKVGEFAVGKQRFVRRWQSLVWTNEGHRRLNRTSYDTAAAPDPALTWQPEYSRVNGELPIDSLGKFVIHRGNDPTSFVRFEVEVSTPGKIALAFNSAAGLRYWYDGKPTPLQKEMIIEATRGRHTITLAINQVERHQPLRVGLKEIEGSPAKAQIVGGK